MPASRALSSTGISAMMPAHPLGGEHGHLQGDVGAQRGAADHGLVDAEVVQQRDDLLAERGHRVVQRVVGPVGATVTEQVDRHHVGPGAGQVARQRLVHPAGHQLSVDQHDPPVAAAVLGVLQPVAVVEELADPLRNQGHEVTFARARGRGSAPSASWAVQNHLRPGQMVNNQQVNRSSPASNGLLVGALVVAAYLAGAWTLEVGQVTGSAAPLVARRRDRRGGGAAHAAAALADGLRAPAARLRARQLDRGPFGPRVSSLLGLADVAETIIVATLIRKYVGRYGSRDIADVWRLFAIATAGRTGRRHRHRAGLRPASRHALWPVLGPTMPSHAASVLLLAPVALLRRRAQRAVPPATSSSPHRCS